MRRLLVLLLFTLLAAGCRGVGTSPFASPPPVEGDGWRVRFEGNVSLPTAELIGVIASHLVEFRDQGLTKPGFDDAAYEIEVHYRSRGFPDAYVDYEYVEGATIRATFLIEEGRRVVLDRVRLPGAVSFPADELSAFFPTRRKGLFAEGPRYFVRARLDDGVSRLRSFYRQSGFLDAVVSAPALTFTPDGTHVEAAVTIVEGPRYTLAARDVELSGSLGVRGERAAFLRRLPEEFLQPDGAPPPPYTPRLAHALRAHLRGRYGEWGYPDCRIEMRPVVDSNTGRVTLGLDIDAGPRVRIAAVELRGNEKTRGSFIRHHLGIEAGEDYDASAIRAAFERLFATGLFDAVTIELAESAAAERTLVVTVTEAPSRELFVEPGYGSYEGPRLRFGAEDKNLFGTGRSLRAESAVSLLAQSVTLGFLERALFRSEVQASTNVFAHRRVEPSYTLSERGAGAELSRAWRRSHLLATVGYRFRATDLTEIDIVDPVAQALLEDVDISSISASLTRDTRDHPLMPGRGNRARLSVEWASKALGSELDFFAARVEEVHFLPLPWPGGVLGLSARAGVIEPTGDTDVIPLQQRYFNGGENTVRSFKENELGPRDSTGEPLGGEAFSLFTAELRQDLFARFSGALFFDAGNVSPTVEDWSSFAGIRTAVGVGLRYLLPIGPLRLDVGFNPDPRDQEDDYVIHLSVGMSF